MFNTHDVTRLATESGMQRNEDGSWKADLAHMQIYTNLLEQARDQYQIDVFRSMFDERAD